MLRRLLLYLSEREDLKDRLLKVPALRRVAERFVAGGELSDALDAAGRLNDDGLRVTLDHLGESVEHPDQARRAADDYVRSLERIDGRPVEATISLKLTQLGLDIDRDLCRENLERIVRRAAELGNFVRVDMESSDYTGATLELFTEAFRDHRNVGAVIQSYLRRSERDVERLVEMGAPVRIVKGAYDEPPEVAFQDREEVDASFARLTRRLLEGGVPTAVATHDERMIDATLDHARELDLSPGDFEFQMLYGVRRPYQRELAEAGHPVRIYLPYGSDWYPYLMRRMAEKPANLQLVLRSMIGG